ncbi:acyl-CoA dehydrogenase family protein [Alkalihalobacillus sp. AL-G]|uniref:acyl-CoA dehydrogenase family protein n=1 Tax=Alkalihalobacillus sp. AL-G TaxID=2926399 RepID=UPI00272A9623|nr:acyl-CoA dehydrogenase family protein [Alkalihalobacillus sp. AL-G]WLD91619.1 acyl-CoA/acyl-ACP dehydrogenase [Alkalihalobacillus sp. AL-G]
MWDIHKPLIQNDRQYNLYKIAEELSGKVKLRATETDQQAAFSQENLYDLKEAGYLSLTLPGQYGGQNLSLYEFVLLQERLAVGDGSVALSIGWHLGIVMELRDEQLWKPETLKWLANEISKQKKLVNRAATERATGSPTRGGIPETRAVPSEGSYLINGRKTFTTMADVLDYFIVSAFIEEEESIGWFIIEKGQDGVDVDYTWDTLGMRGTGSDDLVLTNVKVPVDRLVEIKDPTKKEPALPKGWLLHIPACYLGIAIAARNEALEFAKSYQPNSLTTTISKVPHIQQKIGEMDLELLYARHFMYSIAEKWDKEPENRMALGPELAAVKTIATNAAQHVVDLAMKIAGGRGLSKNANFERYYRDVRAGLHNPPMDDAVIGMLAARAIND